MDGTVFMTPFAANRLKLFQWHNVKNPLIHLSWKCPTDDKLNDTENLMDDMPQEITNDIHESENAMATYEISKIKNNCYMPLGIPMPWQLHGKEANKHWIKVWNNWKSGKTKE